MVLSELHSTTYGEQGSRVVFCHGLFGQGRNWTTQAKALAPDHRVLLVDLPQHGRSPWRERFDYVAMADEVATLLEGTGGPADPVALVGHSMGGKVAMLVALRHPALVERLCVVDIAPVAYSAARDFAHYVVAMRDLDLDAVDTRADADRAMTEAVPDAGVRAFLLQNLRRDAGATEGAGWRWQVNLDVLGDQLPDLAGWPEGGLNGVPPYDGPVLWVAGARSDYVAPEHGDAMRALFPQTRQVTVKGAGHWVHSEQPEVFGEILRRFVG